jgi:protein required for attachment to host cells
MKAWIVIADAASARIIETAGLNKPLRLVQEISHPASRAKTSELVSDGRGRIDKGLGRGVHSAMEARTPPHEVEAATFAREIAQVLADGSARHAFQTIALVAPAHFLGLLRESIDPQIIRWVVTTLEKDFVHLDLRDLHERLQEVIRVLMRPLDSVADR